MASETSCAHCGATFKPRNARSRYCSRACANARPRPSADELRTLYVEQRQPLRVIAEQNGVSIAAAAKWLAEAGIPRRSNSEARPARIPKTQRVPRDHDFLHRLYVDEQESARVIAARFGVEKITVLRVLRELGIERRPNTSRSDADLRRRARVVQKQARLSRPEAELLSALRGRGLHPTPHLAVDKFNVDLAFPDARLGVEVDGGNWHSTHQRKIQQDDAKAIHLTATGWTLVRVKTRRKRWVTEALATIEQALATRGCRPPRQEIRRSDSG